MSKQVLELALEALIGLQRAGRKQGFNDGYPREMDCAAMAVSALDEAINRPQADGLQQQGDLVAWFREAYPDQPFSRVRMRNYE